MRSRLAAVKLSTRIVVAGDLQAVVGGAAGVGLHADGGRERRVGAVARQVGHGSLTPVPGISMTLSEMVWFLPKE